MDCPIERERDRERERVPNGPSTKLHVGKIFHEGIQSEFIYCHTHNGESIISNKVNR